MPDLTGGSASETNSPPSSRDQASSFEGADICPHCGTLLDPDADPMVCLHYLGGWSLDVDDNGGGVLGESMLHHVPLPTCPGFAPLWDIAKAFRRVAIIGGPVDDAEWRDRLRRALRTVYGQDVPTFWADIDTYDLLDREDLSDPRDDDPLRLGRLPTSLLGDWLEGVGGVTVSAGDITDGAVGMGGGISVAWGQEPERAVEAIEARLAAVLAEVQAVAKALGAEMPSTDPA